MEEEKPKPNAEQPVTNAESEPLFDSNQPTKTTQPNSLPNILLAILLTVVILIFGIVFAYKKNFSQRFSQTNPQQPIKIQSENNSLSFLKNEQENEIKNSTVVDTNQRYCFNNRSVITCGQSFRGQDAQYQGNQPSYQDNKDGTITDLNTGLMWIKEAGKKQTYYSAINSAKNFSYAGYSDWRVPTIKELYSLMDFNGTDPDSQASTSAGLVPFLDGDYFGFSYGDTSSGDRVIDSQWVTSSIYAAKVMRGQECFFGVNFADGRIKCYPTGNGAQAPKEKTYYLRLVRGQSYGQNDFFDNGNGTVTDNSSDLMWQKSDSQKGLDWNGSLEYCEELQLAGYSDWRLPNAKELQYIVDYSKSPDATGSAAIDPVFESSSLTNMAGEKDYPYYWTGTTHLKSNGIADSAAYIGFGRCMGEMNGKIMDVHGAGCQRSDPKAGNPDDYPQSGHGPQGDVRRIFNHARCVRGGVAQPSVGQEPSTFPLKISADSDANQEKDGHPEPKEQTNENKQPPGEAIQACNEKKENDSCQFQTPKELLTGICRNNNQNLACIPK